MSGSFASTASTVLKIALPVVCSRPQRETEAAASAAVRSRPLWNFTPLRSMKV